MPIHGDYPGHGVTSHGVGVITLYYLCTSRVSEGVTILINGTGHAGPVQPGLL